MPKYASVPLPRYDGDRSGPETVLAGIDRWTASEPMRDLVADFGGHLPGAGTAANLDYLEDFSADHWDFRAGRERFETGAERFGPERESSVYEAALALGLAGGSRPGKDRYTHVLVLGGLFSSCLFRTRFAAELIEGGIAAPRVTGVGGFRPLGDQDAQIAALEGVADCRFEVDAMEAGLRRAFGITAEPEIERGGDPEVDPGRAWKVATCTTDTVTVQAVAAPSSEPERRRANTVDTCRFWADRVADLGPADRVLVVTSSLFVPFQHCDALSHMGLPYGCGVETVGVDTTRLPESHYRKNYSASAYLQEARSAIRSMRRLYDVAKRQHPREQDSPHVVSGAEIPR